MNEKAPGKSTNKPDDAEVAGPFAEWPPKPGIGQLDTKELKGVDVPVLHSLLRKRYGLRDWDIFKKFPEGKLWNESTVLKTVILFLEGRTGEDIAEFINSERESMNNSGAENKISANDVAVAISKFTNVEIAEIGVENRKRTVKWHALLYPENQQTEQLLVELEEALKLPRTRIFNYEGYLPSTREDAGVNQVDVAIQILHDKVIGRMSTEKIIEDIKSRFNFPEDTPIEKNNISVLYSKILSPEAKQNVSPLPTGKKPYTPKWEKTKKPKEPELSEEDKLRLERGEILKRDTVIVLKNGIEAPVKGIKPVLPKWIEVTQNWSSILYYKIDRYAPELGKDIYLVYPGSFPVRREDMILGSEIRPHA